MEEPEKNSPNLVFTYHKYINYKYLKKIKSVAYSSQGSHTGQLHFCNWLADSNTTG